MGKSAKSIFGKEGESFAATYLESLGYRVIRQNFREKFGELDLVARDKKGCLVFIEVKTMRPNDIKPEDQMTRSKIMKFRKISEFFANSHPELLNENEGWRVDAICLTKMDNYYDIKHYKNVA